jgi:hypothetical protein
MSVEAVFEFVAENPPTVMIAGGILFVLLSAFMGPFDPADASLLASWAPWLVGGGVILQILWLVLRFLT